jgi:hypothetical protein
VRKPFNLEATRRKSFTRVAHLCRYLHAPLADVLQLASSDADELIKSLNAIVEEEGRQK